MEGRCELGDCHKIGYGVYRLEINSRPYNVRVGNTNEIRWTKPKKQDMVLCIECSFSAINRRWATLMNEGFPNENWARGDRYSAVNLLYALPLGEAFVEWAKDWEREHPAKSPRTAKPVRVAQLTSVPSIRVSFKR